MRAYVPAYEWKTPKSLAAALDLLAAEPGAWRPFAGGTDLMVLFEAGKLMHRRFLNIWDLAELRGVQVQVTGARVAIGALTTYSELRAHPVIAREFPMLCQSSAETGGVAIQNRGTLGGNIANASPAADSGPVLLAYDAEIELVSSQGFRMVPYRSFHTGYKQMDMRPDELLRGIHLPIRREYTEWRDYFRKVGTRKAQAISKVCYAQRAHVEGGRIAEIRIGLGSIAPTVVRASATEVFLTGRAIDHTTIAAARKMLSTEIEPIDDIRSTAAYRRNVTMNLLEDALRRLQL